MDEARDFYSLAVVIGLVQGGVQSLSRSYYGSLVPPDKSSEFFGFYNMMGKASAIFGPALVGVTAAVTHDSRLSILSIVVLFLAGGALLVVATRKHRDDAA
jgi:UMF1 family MFS transporter